MKFICICILAFACAACMLGCGGSAPEDDKNSEQCIPADFVGPYLNPNHLPVCSGAKGE